MRFVNGSRMDFRKCLSKTALPKLTQSSQLIERRHKQQIASAERDGLVTGNS